MSFVVLIAGALGLLVLVAAIAITVAVLVAGQKRDDR